MPHPPRFKLLALDGGGIRGLTTLFCLQKIMQLLPLDGDNHFPKPCHYFDLIVGTGTGGLFAIMLGRLEMTVDQCIDVYINLITRLQGPNESFMSIPWAEQRRVKSNSTAVREVMEQAAADHLGDKDALMRHHRLGPGTCKVAVAAKMHVADKRESCPVFFTSYYAKSQPIEEFEHPRVWEVAQATMADDDFEIVEMRLGRVARLFHNRYSPSHKPNPVFELWGHATREFGKAGKVEETLRCLISIGTGGDQRSANSSHSAHSYRLGHYVERARAIEADFTRFIDRDDPRYCRLDPESGSMKADLFGDIKTISGSIARYLQDSRVQRKVTMAAELLRDVGDESWNHAIQRAVSNQDISGTIISRALESRGSAPSKRVTPVRKSKLEENLEAVESPELEPTPDLTKRSNSLHTRAPVSSMRSPLTVASGSSFQSLPGAPSSNTWFERLDRVVDVMRARKKLNVQDASYRRVKIAVLDTGLDPNHVVSREVHYKDFVQPASPCMIDNTSHGTVSVDLILKASCDLDLYVGRVFEMDCTDGVKEPLQMARGIDWAVQQDVDIISISAGFLTTDDELRKAIERASKSNVLIFAAASNWGNTQASVAYPASEKDHVFCIFACNSMFQVPPTGMNPKSQDNDDNFAMLGMNIDLCPGSGQPPVSGSSMATALAAGLAARVLDFAGHRDSRVAGCDAVRIHTRSGLRAVLRSISRTENRFQCIDPSLLWEHRTMPESKELTRERIQKVITKAFRELDRR